MGYGNMWHVCEEFYGQQENSHKATPWGSALMLHAKQMCLKYKNQQDTIEYWWNICKKQFTAYLNFWEERESDDDYVEEKLFRERVFNVPYKLPSGRIVRLRGKWDGLDLMDGGLYLLEHKTKSDVDRGVIERQLGFDLQTMLYLVALDWQKNNALLGGSHNEVFMGMKKIPLSGVRYNVVRRPVSGGKHTIRQRQDETPKDFYDRLGGLIEGDGDWFFARWRSEVLGSDIKKFRRECLDPILETLCNWWEWIQECMEFSGEDNSPFYVSPRKESGYRVHHWRHPFGVWNILDEGGFSDVDNYLATGSEIGLQRINNLFPELTAEEQDEEAE